MMCDMCKKGSGSGYDCFTDDVTKNYSLAINIRISKILENEPYTSVFVAHKKVLFCFETCVVKSVQVATRVVLLQSLVARVLP